MPKKILLADDSITIQKVVELTFSDGDYEVTAVNNGSKAIQKLSEMRPDIILSDIIMPEKNGYEVCEYVKSHPEYRNIPVVLLTGTFEPFDPDRADKAGCDAVVTKPFESQSLIHKVEELIDQARAASAAAAPAVSAPAPRPEPETSMSEPGLSPEAEATPWTDEMPAVAAPPPPLFTHGSDIFNAKPPARPTAEMPFSAPPPPPPADQFSGETRGFPPAMLGEALQQSNSTQQIPAQSAAPTPPPPPPPGDPWAVPTPPAGETRAFPKMNFGDLHGMVPDTPAADDTPTDDSPFGAPPPPETFSGETRSFPKMNFDNFQSAAPKAEEPPPPPPPAEQPSSLWDEQPPAFSGATRAFPRVTYDQFKPAETSAPSWNEEPAAASSSPAWASKPAASIPEAAKPEPEPEKPAAATAVASGNGTDLSEEQIDRIARRVVQLMSDQVVKNIAWEVIPDLAEMVVKERIRQLEAE
ncbi:MAG: response regulator [Thermoanaerobaculia bacterium]|nr:response regulator [Thermoanaerobaculia bacterium]